MDFRRHDSGVRCDFEKAAPAVNPARAAMRHRRALDLAIPCRVASQQSSTLFRQAIRSIPSLDRESISTRLQDFRLWMVLQHNTQTESHSRAIKDYPQLRRATQVVRLPRSTMGRSQDQDGHRDSDRAPCQRSCDLLELRPAGARLRPSATAAVRVCTAVADCGFLRVRDAACELPAVWGEGGKGPLV